MKLAKHKIVRIILAVLAVCVVIDQLSKLLISTFLNGRIGFSFLALEKLTNDGMAFGFNNGNVKNIFMTIFVLGIILNFISKQIDQIDAKTGIVLGLILGGGISNLIDRFFRKGVLDFIKVGKFFTCNIADIFIFVGWLLLIVYIIFFSNKNSEKKEEQKSEG